MKPVLLTYLQKADKTGNYITLTLRIANVSMVVAHDVLGPRSVLGVAVMPSRFNVRTSCDSGYCFFYVARLVTAGTTHLPECLHLLALARRRHGVRDWRGKRDATGASQHEDRRLTGLCCHMQAVRCRDSPVH